MPSGTHDYFKPRRLGHVNLWTNDIAASERFYSRVCGLNVEFTEPGLVASFLGTGHTPHDLGLIEKTGGEARLGRDGTVILPPGIGFNAGLNHMAWELKNEAELVAAYRNLEGLGLKVDMTVDHQIAHSVYLRDPDGNQVEFYCDTVRDWRTVLHGEMDLITSFWDPLTAEGFVEPRYEERPTLKTAPGALVTPQRLSHAVLETADMATMVDFYTTVGGLAVRQRLGDDAVVLLGGSLDDYELNLALVAADAPGYHHVAFQMADETQLDTAAVRLAARGLEATHQIETPWKRAIFLRDGDGLGVEFYARRPAPRALPVQPKWPMAYYV